MEAAPHTPVLAHNRSSLTIAPCCSPTLAVEDEKSIQAIASRLKRDEPALSGGSFIAPGVQQGLSNAPALIFGDQQEINLFSGNTPSALEYRMAVLAQAGDIFAVHQRDKAFETYLARYLKLSGTKFIATQNLNAGPSTPIAIECRTNERLRASIHAIANQTGRLQLLPFNTTGNVWRLAQDIAERCNAEVRVAGPSPRIAHRANNKVWFTNRVRELLGPQALPPSHGAFGPAAAAGHIARLARTNRRVVLKIPDSAGSAGNLAFDQDELRGKTISDIRSELLDILQALGWQQRYPVLVGVWDCDVVSSPSVQAWLPLEGEGYPVIEGIFEQSVQGEAGTFIGARRAVLNEHLNDQLVTEAMLFASLFQALGYYGRCSFDAIISKSPGQSPILHWIECNARWGGVSIPLSLANSLRPSQPYRGLVVVQQTMIDTATVSTERLIGLLDGLLYEHHKSRSGLILMSPPGQGPEMRINFLAIADDQEAAEALSRTAIGRLAGM